MYDGYFSKSSKFFFSVSGMYSLIVSRYVHRHCVSRWAYPTTYSVGCLVRSGGVGAGGGGAGATDGWPDPTGGSEATDGVIAAKPTAAADTRPPHTTFSAAVIAVLQAPPDSPFGHFRQNP